MAPANKCSRPGCELIKVKGENYCEGCLKPFKPVVTGIDDKSKQS